MSNLYVLRAIGVAVASCCLLGALSLAVASPASAGGLSCSAQTSTLKLCSARTDNYKDCFNAPDDVRELRTWLSWRDVRAGGARYRKRGGQSQFATRIKVRRVSGPTSMPARAVVTVSVGSGGGNVRNLDFRNGDPPQMWGPLLELRHVIRRTAPVRLRVRLRAGDGSVLGSVRVAYRRDSRIVSAASGHVEHNGPGGRWWVAGRRTRTDWELGASSQC